MHKDYSFVSHCYATTLERLFIRCEWISRLLQCFSFFLFVLFLAPSDPQKCSFGGLIQNTRDPVVLALPDPKNVRLGSHLKHNRLRRFVCCNVRLWKTHAKKSLRRSNIQCTLILKKSACPALVIIWCPSVYGLLRLRYRSSHAVNAEFLDDVLFTYDRDRLVAKIVIPPFISGAHKGPIGIGQL